MFPSFCDRHWHPERKKLLTYGEFRFLSASRVLKKKMWCSADETDGSLENHKYPAKFSTCITSKADILQVLGQFYAFHMGFLDALMHICGLWAISTWNCPILCHFQQPDPSE